MMSARVRLVPRKLLPKAGPVESVCATYLFPAERLDSAADVQPALAQSQTMLTFLSSDGHHDSQLREYTLARRYRRRCYLVCLARAVALLVSRSAMPFLAVTS